MLFGKKIQVLQQPCVYDTTWDFVAALVLFSFCIMTLFGVQCPKQPQIPLVVKFWSSLKKKTGKTKPIAVEAKPPCFQTNWVVPAISPIEKNPSPDQMIELMTPESPPKTLIVDDLNEASPKGRFSKNELNTLLEFQKQCEEAALKLKSIKKNKIPVESPKVGVARKAKPSRIPRYIPPTAKSKVGSFRSTSTIPPKNFPDYETPMKVANAVGQNKKTSLGRKDSLRRSLSDSSIKSKILGIEKTAEATSKTIITEVLREAKKGKSASTGGKKPTKTVEPRMRPNPSMESSKKSVAIWKPVGGKSGSLSARGPARRPDGPNINVNKRSFTNI